ncbi:MAG: LacI family transcriptional regulator [Bifidobacteriaceae bacterium]|jgi:DNA-binding LacI/PurR family transcriptional regulator|nr:LacI family transcriptional regulator [Bifidobacteriaceae bacterium]
MANYHDIRRLTGLSLSTISKYFNGRTVLPANRAAIEAAAEQLGVRPNANARALRSRRSQRVGVLVPSLGVGFHMAIVAGIEEALRPRGLSVIVRSAGGEHAPDTTTAAEELAATLVDGMFVIPRSIDRGPLAQVGAQGVPLVFIDRPGAPGDNVLLDNRGAVAVGVRHLLDHGHTHLGLLTGDPGIWTMRERLAGARHVLEQREIPSRTVELADSPLTAAGGRQAMAHLLALHPRPTAILAFNYHLTLGALTTLAESGLRAPDDISLVGFDTDDIDTICTPRLTHIIQPVDQIAGHAARLMLARLDNPDQPHQTITIPAALTVGGSVRRLNAAG